MVSRDRRDPIVTRGQDFFVDLAWNDSLKLKPTITLYKSDYIRAWLKYNNPLSNK